MIIVNGKTRTFVAFGDITQQQLDHFMARMQGAVQKFEHDGRPNSGDLA